MLFVLFFKTAMIVYINGNREFNRWCESR